MHNCTEGNNMKIEMRRFGKRFEPVKEKRKKKTALLGISIFLLIAVMIIALISIKVETVIRHCVVAGQEDTWAASVASYWGGIIGGVFSGILAFIGVFYTIRYYKESDAKKERAAVQPFLLVELGQDPKRELNTGFSLGNQTDDKEKQKTINVAMKNIGHGFANTLVIHTGFNVSGLAFNKVINIGDYAYTFFVLNTDNLNDGVRFAIQYIDSMTNEYIQEYTIKTKHGTINIECGYPQLLKQ